MAPSKQYQSEYPKDLSFSPENAKFIADFYAVSDSPGAHSDYASYFAPMAALTMASTSVTGSKEILALRKGMWEKVEKRSHFPEKVFPFGAGSDEVMIYGTVDYVLKEGGEVKGVPWAARGKIGEDGLSKVWVEYQVYLDTAARDKK